MIMMMMMMMIHTQDFTVCKCAYRSWFLSFSFVVAFAARPLNWYSLEYTKQKTKYYRRWCVRLFFLLMQMGCRQHVAQGTQVLGKWWDWYIKAPQFVVNRRTWLFVLSILIMCVTACDILVNIYLLISWKQTNSPYIVNYSFRNPDCLHYYWRLFLLVSFFVFFSGYVC